MLFLPVGPWGLVLTMYYDIHDYDEPWRAHLHVGDTSYQSNLKITE